jgi:hypothetical protein
MRIEIEKYVKHTEIIEVELPYYYKHAAKNQYGKSVIFGKIEENKYTLIQRTENVSGKVKYEILTENHNATLSDYFNKEYKSSKEEFEEGKEECLAFLNKM